MPRLIGVFTVLVLVALLGGCDPCRSCRWHYNDPPSTAAKMAPADFDLLVARIAATPLPHLPATPRIAIVISDLVLEYDIGTFDKDSGARWFAPLESANLATFEDTTLRGGDEKLEDVLKRAVSARTDAVLVIEEQVEVTDAGTVFGVLYPTIVGLLIAPGSYRERTVLLDATLWNPYSGQPIFSVTAEARRSVLAPYAWIDERDIVARAERAAIAQLVERLTEELGKIRAAPGA